MSAELVEGLQGTSLFLIGMMGSGKSTVGKLISQALGYCFFDTGAWVGGLFVAESRLGLLEIKSCSAVCQAAAKNGPYASCTDQAWRCCGSACRC